VITSSSIAPLRVAAIPLASRPGDMGENVSRVVAWLDRAALAGIALAVFPEACLSGANGALHARRTSRAQQHAIAEPLDGAAIGAIAQAVERTGVAAGVGWMERAADGRCFNSYAVCLPGGARFSHRKLHTGTQQVGNGSRFTVFDTQWGVRVGILIGADNEVVENARITALMGATLLLAPHRCGPGAAADGGDAAGFGSIDALRRALPGRALDNGTFIVLAAGEDDDDARAGAWGTATIVDPRGRVLVDSLAGPSAGSLPRSSADAADLRLVVSAELDRSLVNASVSEHWRAARRPALYRPLTAAARGDARPPERAPEQAVACGAVPVSFAVVRRSIKLSSSGGAS
jgi:predicted amidohydrolase